MSRRLPLLLPLALAACGPTDKADPLDLAVGLGSVQPALEAETALALALSDCGDCRQAETLRQHLFNKLGACATVVPVVEATSSCPGVNGRSGVNVALVSCELGLDGPVSAKRFLVTPGDAAGAYAFDLLELKHAGSTVASCGTSTVGSGKTSLAYDALVVGPIVDRAELRLAENVAADASGVSRNGTGLGLITVNGVGYDIDFTTTGLVRAKGTSFPGAGTIGFETDDGAATLTFSAQTPVDGSASFRVGEGEAQTVDLGG